ncbi:hypothetical protein N7488_012024 [Penicillium malachiteum]|nr:hypothetical protein N7488_012024 [Penicillium malachiteum]
MPRSTNREEVIARLRKTVNDGSIIVGAGAGIGLSAKAVGAGGVDLILIYNSGRFRMAGLVVEMAQEVLPIIKNAPVLAGVCGTDPFRKMPTVLAELKALGLVGVQNFPTVGLIDGQFRQNLEETGMGYDQEVEMIATAHKLGLVTTPYVFNTENAVKMAQAGADVVVAHAGLTTSGSIGAQSGRSLEDCVKFVQDIRDAAVAVNPEILVLCHGGPIARPADAEFVLSRTVGVHGFFGASSMERLPVEIAIKENAEEFKRLKVRLE